MNHPPLPDDYFNNRDVEVKIENEENEPTPPKRPRLRIMSIQAEPDVPLEHFCVDGFYTVKQEELRDEELSRMLESGTSGEVDPKGLLKMTLVDEGYEPEKVIGMATVSNERHYTVRMKGISAVDYLPVALMERDYPELVADFFQGYNPQGIVDITRVHGELSYKVKVQGKGKVDLMPADVMKKKYPQLVDDFNIWRANLVKE